MALFAAQSKVSNEDDSTVQSRQISTEGHHLSCSKMWSRRFPCFQNRSWSIPVYCSSSIQLGLIAGISFLCPGMWNALNGLGGGGLVQAGPANSANVALYGTFSIVGFFAGIATNKLGVRITLSLGGLGYSLYASSLLCYKHTQNSGFLLFAGVQLGACAGVFWSAQSMTAISYPTGRSTGKSISWFWMVYNLGAVLGSLVSSLCT
jgi:MFS family permease